MICSAPWHPIFKGHVEAAVVPPSTWNVKKSHEKVNIILGSLSQVYLPTWYDLVNLISQVDTISGIRWQGEDDTNRCLGGGRPWCQMSKIRWFFLMVSVCFSDSADFCWFLLISASLRILLALSHGQTSAPSSWCSTGVQPTAGSPGHLVWFDTVATWRIQIQTWDWSLTKFLQFSVSVGTNQYAIPSLFGR